MDIYDIRERILAGRYGFTDHADLERSHDALELADLKACILSGEIIAEDTDTNRGTEYLIEGQTPTKARLRVKVGIDDLDRVVFITVYAVKRRGR